MEREPQTGSQNEELSIETIEGLKQFLSYAAADFEELRELIKQGESEEGQAILSRAKHAYEKLQLLVETCARTIQFGSEISPDNATELQQHYDVIATSLDSVTGAYSDVLDREPESLAESVAVNEVLPVEYENGPLAQVEDFSAPEEKTLPVDHNEFTELNPEVNNEDVVGLAEDLRSVNEKLVTTTREIDDALEKYEEAATAPSVEGVFNMAAYSYSQLQKLRENCSRLVSEVEGLSGTKLGSGAEIAILHFTNEANELQKNLEQIIDSLDEHFEVDDTPEVESVLTADADVEEIGFQDEDDDSVEKIVPILQKLVSSEVDWSDPKERIAANDNEKPKAEIEPPRFVHHTKLDGLKEKRAERNINTELTPFIKKALTNLRYRDMVDELFDSPVKLEVLLRRKVNMFEPPSKLDSWMGIKHKSAFAFLKDKTLVETELFFAQPRENILSVLEAENIDHYIFMKWMDDLIAMKQIVRPSQNMTFGELFVRAELEEMLYEFETTKRKKIA